MKKLFCIIFVISLIISCWAVDFDINKTILYSTRDWFHSEVNFFDGHHLFFYNSNDFILSKKNTVWLKIEYNPVDNAAYYERYCYNQLGQVISMESDYHDYYKDYYNYDEKNRLVSYGDYHMLSYPNDFTGEDYNDGKLEDSWQYSWDGDVFVINVKGGAWNYRRRFIMENGKVVTVNDTTYYPNKTSEHYYDYKYDGNRLIKIVDRYGEDDIRRVSNIEYYNDDEVERIITTYYEKGKASFRETSIYSDYDIHGNWTVRRVYRDGGKLINSIRRKIVYCDVPDNDAFLYYVNDDRVRLRNQPGLTSEIITTLDKGTVLEVIDEKKVDVNDKYSWCQVRTKDGKLGWMYGEYVSP